MKKWKLEDNKKGNELKHILEDQEKHRQSTR